MQDKSHSPATSPTARCLEVHRGFPRLVETSVAEHEGSPADVQDIGRELTELMEGFGNFVAGLEPRFLTLGQNVREVVAELQRLLKGAADGFSILRSEAGPKPTAEIHESCRHALEEARVQLGHVFRRIRGRHRGPVGFVSLRSYAFQLRQIARSLRSSIEAMSGVVGEKESGSAFLADLRELWAEVNTLAERADDTSRGRLDPLDRDWLGMSVTGICGFANGVNESFVDGNGKTNWLLERMHQAIARIDQHRHIIGQQTGSIVYHLQCGDLVRQQSEHVALSLQAALEDSAHRSSHLILGTAAAQIGVIQTELEETYSRLSVSYRALTEELEKVIACGRELELLPRRGTAPASLPAVVSEVLALSKSAGERLINARTGLEILASLVRDLCRCRERIVAMHGLLPWPGAHGLTEATLRLLEPCDFDAAACADRSSLFLPRLVGTESGAGPDGADDIELF